MKKYENFLFETFPFLVVNFSIYLHRRVFVMVYPVANVAGRKKQALYSKG